ncbi:hypothetical protein [Amycolatopsis cihanbeyliensis]|uniref:Uncharacterized protein n=1 Tax=Amycolatopsis cihanbeyliensis TaxID=1128664 RepID=A0A542DRX3_AMYCI|nr:hypothetical protein [Amycolatopsis cihanbeyliensis]TQJ05871.1 hypothetical protein FB471_5716 [Amycolatopsis cihanbeyliensis]
MARGTRGARRGLGRQPASVDWRERMALRGGPVNHALARAGWAILGMLGAILGVGLASWLMATPTGSLADNSAVANFVAGLILFVPAGAVFGCLTGVLAQFVARSWLRTPTEAERRLARETQADQADTARFAGHGLHPSGRWARSFETCANSVAAYHSIVAATPEGAGRDWFARIGETLDGELTEALRLAKLGESLESGVPSGPGQTAWQVSELLRAAETAFAETTERAAAIALNLRAESDFTHIRAQLDMLAGQAPRLRAYRIG